MRRVEDAELRLLRAGLLDPEEAYVLESRLALDPDAQRRLAELPLPEPEPLPPEGPRVPPPGYGLPLVLARDAQLADDRICPGDSLHIDLPVPEDAEQRVVVLLQREESDDEIRWTLLAPEEGQAPSALDEFPLLGDVYRVTLNIDGQPGRRRWAIALPTREILREGPLLSVLSEGTLQGRFPVGSVEFLVENAG